MLASNNQIALSPAAATITITDGDAITAMSMTVRGPATVNEGSSAVYTVDLGAEVTGSAVTVSIVGSGVANPATHYSLSDTSITIAAGASSGTFTLTTTNGGGARRPAPSAATIFGTVTVTTPAAALVWRRRLPVAASPEFSASGK